MGSPGTDGRPEELLGCAGLRVLGRVMSTRLAIALRWFALLLLCSAYLQGGFNKATDFPGAVAEMTHFGLRPAWLMAALVIALEWGASAMVLTGIYGWWGALALAAFTLAATFMAQRFWALPPTERFMAANTFFEHLGLVGGFLLVAWHDWPHRAGEPTR